MNEKLRLSFVGKLYDEDDAINFDLVTTSDLSVIFPSDFNLNLIFFDNEQNEWTNVKNNMNYLPEDAKYIVGINDPIKERDRVIIPFIPSLGNQTDLRVVVHGRIYENGIETNQCAGAFMDFVFTP